MFRLHPKSLEAQYKRALTKRLSINVFNALESLRASGDVVNICLEGGEEQLTPTGLVMNDIAKAILISQGMASGEAFPELVRAFISCYNESRVDYPVVANVLLTALDNIQKEFNAFELSINDGDVCVSFNSVDEYTNRGNLSLMPYARSAPASPRPQPASVRAGSADPVTLRARTARLSDTNLRRHIAGRNASSAPSTPSTTRR